MMVLSMKKLPLSCLLAATILHLASSSTITVSPNCTSAIAPPCTDLESALQNLSSDTTLLLSPEKHYLGRSHQGQYKTDLRNVSIVGNDWATITCADGVGVVFVGVTDLVIANVEVCGCGLSNDSLRSAIDATERLVDLSFTVPYAVRIGLFLGHVTNLDMSHSLVTGTTGLGMLAINIVGNSQLRGVNFTHNVRVHCEVSLEDVQFQFDAKESGAEWRIGGGAYFLFQDPNKTASASADDSAANSSSLSISACHFEGNAECTYTGYRNVNLPYLRRLVVGGGGGLTVYLAQASYAMQVVVSRSDFTKNDARYGSGAHVGFFMESGPSDVRFTGCHFNANGLPIYQQSMAKGGGGVAIFTDLSIVQASLAEHTERHAIVFEETRFTQNTVHSEGGGIYTYSLSSARHISSKPQETAMCIASCRFFGNSAQFGSGLFMSQRAAQGTEGNWALFVVGEVTVKGNKPNKVNSGMTKYSAVDLRSMTVNMSDAGSLLVIADNEGSGLHLVSSFLILNEHTSLVLRNNEAHQGGGAYFEGTIPTILFSANSSIAFIGNRAAAEGGAVYYERGAEQNAMLEPLDTTDCFLQFKTLLDPDSSPQHDEMFNSNVTVNFTGNSASLGGMVFGSTLNSCLWANKFNLTNKELFSKIYRDEKATFHFDRAPEGKEQISTDPSAMTVSEHALSSFSGEIKSINLSVFDAFMNQIEAILMPDFSEFTGRNNSPYTVRLGTSGSWYHRINKSVEFQVRGDPINNISVSLYTSNNLVSVRFFVNISRCPLGFSPNASNQTCACDVNLLKNLVECDQSKVELQVPERSWLGCDRGAQCSSTGDLMFVKCYFSFCSPNQTVFNATDPSGGESCARDSHRTGVMCGGCEEGYSAVLGGETCLNCTHSRPGLAVTTSALCGLFAFLLISVGGITIEKGWTYMIIFSSNIIFPYAIYDVSSVVLIKSMLTPMRMLTLNFPYQGCFYDGLDALFKVLCQFLFCAYLYAIMALFTALCYCSSFVSKHFSPSKTLATLFFLTYNLAFKTSSVTVSAITVETVAGENRSVRWIVDPNVRYFHGFHGALGTVGLILYVIYLIPFPLLLLSPSLAYRYGQRFKPFLDAIWAPFKPKYRFWASLRTIVQVIVVNMSYFVVPLLGVRINLVVLSVFLYVQSIVQPFNDPLINAADSFLVLVTILLHYGGSVQLLTQYVQEKLVFGEAFYTMFLISLAYSVLLATLLWYKRHIVAKFLQAMYRCCQSVVRRRRGDSRYEPFDTPTTQVTAATAAAATAHHPRHNPERPTHMSVSVNAEPLYRAPRRWNRDSSQFRESLLEESHESMHFVAS